MSLLLKRLTSQLMSKDNMSYEEAKNMATAILVKRGHLNTDGTNTYIGAIRGAMTADERALDRKKRYAFKKKKKKI